LAFIRCISILLVNALLSVPNIKGSRDEIAQNAKIYIEKTWNESGEDQQVFSSKLHQKINEIGQVRDQHMQHLLPIQLQPPLQQTQHQLHHTMTF